VTLARGFAFCFGGAALLRLIVGGPTDFPALRRVAQTDHLPSASRTRHARTRPSPLSRGERANASYLGGCFASTEALPSQYLEDPCLELHLELNGHA